MGALPPHTHSSVVHPSHDVSGADYDCLKALERGERVAPSNGRCWGDAGNGVQIGWWVWGQAFLRRKLGLL